MARTSPTARTLAKLKRDGFTAGVVEKWIPQTMRRLDFLGGIDIIACGNGEIIGIQCTTSAHAAERVEKLRAEPRLTEWMKNGGKLQVWGWSKKGPRGKRKLWQVTITELEGA